MTNQETKLQIPFLHQLIKANTQVGQLESSLIATKAEVIVQYYLLKTLQQLDTTTQMKCANQRVEEMLQELATANLKVVKYQR